MDKKEIIENIKGALEADFNVRVDILLNTDHFGYNICLSYLYYKSSEKMYHEVIFLVTDLEKWYENDYTKKRKEIFKKLSIK